MTANTDRQLVGVLGGGQLGRMLAQAGRALDVDVRVLDPSADASAGLVCEQVVGAFDDPAALDRLADGCALVTYEFENVPVASARALAERVEVLPPPAALDVAQDRLSERRLFARLHIDAPAYTQVDAPAALADVCGREPMPVLLKARRLGYDGKGQFLLTEPAQADRAWHAIGARPAIVDRFVAFERELSVLAVRDRSGAIRCWPPIENVHRGGILRLSRAPALGVTEALAAQAETAARLILEELDYVGVLAVEFFQVGTGDDARLLANEIAPRVHNSGHWTIEGAETSQFENHLRAVLGLELGPTGARGHAAMINLIGSIPPQARELTIPGATLHDYAKAPRAGRKVGHVTLVADTRSEVDRLLEGFTRVIA